MVVTVTMNPCIDRTITVECLAVESTNPVVETRCEVAGKGINVSIALKNLGLDTCGVGIDYIENGGMVEEYLDGWKIPWYSVPATGALRTNIKIFDKSRSAMTEFNEKGAPVCPEVTEKMIETICKIAEKSRIVVLNGSVPQGVSEKVYATIINRIKHLPVKIIVDAKGDLLYQSLCPQTYLIKPNIWELEQTFGITIKTQEELLACIQKVLHTGVKYVCVSLGKEGALLISREEAYYAPAPEIKVRGVQGAGDSMVAGFCAAILQNLTAVDMLRYSVAVCGGSLLRDGTQMCTKEDFQKLLPKIQVMELAKAPQFNL